MDDSDKATEFEELRRAIALGQRRPEGPQANGFCHFCGKALGEGIRWCDTDCRDDWSQARFQASQRLQGAQQCT